METKKQTNQNKAVEYIGAEDVIKEIEKIAKKYNKRKAEIKKLKKENSLLRKQNVEYRRIAETQAALIRTAQRTERQHNFEGQNNDRQMATRYKDATIKAMRILQRTLYRQTQIERQHNFGGQNGDHQMITGYRYAVIEATREIQKVLSRQQQLGQ